MRNDLTSRKERLGRLTILTFVALLTGGTAAAQAGALLPGEPSALRGVNGGYSQPARLPGWGIAPRASVWVNNDRDFFRRGERISAGFSITVDAYVAVVHIDPDGRLEFLYPTSPLDVQYLRGGRNYTLPYRGGGGSGWLVRSSSGIGYLYVIASPIPLDFGYFRARTGSAWDWSYAGQGVRGDPFWAFEQITRHLVPDWGYTPIAVDYYSYQVGGFQRFPSYACAPRYGNQAWGWGWGWGYTPAYSNSCSRIDSYLVNNPYYFDVARYRGDRRAYFRNYDSGDIDHRYKVDPSVPARPSTTAAPRTVPSTSTTQPRTTVQPERRPALERREPAATPAPTARTAPQPSAAGQGSTTRSAPQPAASPPPTARTAPQPSPSPSPTTRRADPATESTPSQPGERERPVPQ